MRVLFVCAGNTCRSPMAAAIASSVLLGVTTDSAGWSPGDAVAGNAAVVVKEMTGADISSHRPRDVAERDLSKYERIVVLDPRVVDELVVPVGVDLVVWDVADPYGQSLESYRQCARDLLTRIQDFAE